MTFDSAPVQRCSGLLLLIRRLGDETVENDLGAVRFVPLIGAQGWDVEVP